MRRYRFRFLIALPTIVFTLSGVPLPATAAAPSATDHVPRQETRMALRDLWVEHVFWIRSYVIASSSKDASQAAVAEQQVVANAKALAGTITPFYGQAATDSLFQLLAGHWGGVKDYHAATLAGSKSAQDAAVAKVTANARDIAKFLSGANPNLPEDVVFGLLSAHGGHHVAQINQIVAHDFAAEAQTWHAMRKHMLMISDALLDGIAKQFPVRFAGT